MPICSLGSRTKMQTIQTTAKHRVTQGQPHYRSFKYRLELSFGLACA